jgi:hypothetical protein
MRNQIYKRRTYCYCPESLEKRKMAYQGFEEERGSLKYRCPAMAYGYRYERLVQGA